MAPLETKCLWIRLAAMGDPACWLGATCISCGRILTNDLDGDFCHRCDEDEMRLGEPLAEGERPVSVNPAGSPTRA